MIESREHVPTALGIGELLWDLLPDGERLGGAPFNVVAHLRRFGWRCAYVSAVGRDALGRRALEEAGRLGIDRLLIEVNERPTGVVRVRLDAAGVPDYEIVSPAAYEAITGPPRPSRPSSSLGVFASKRDRARSQNSSACPSPARLSPPRVRVPPGDRHTPRSGDDRADGKIRRKAPVRPATR